MSFHPYSSPRIVNPVNSGVRLCNNQTLNNKWNDQGYSLYNMEIPNCSNPVNTITKLKNNIYASAGTKIYSFISSSTIDQIEPPIELKDESIQLL